MLHAALPESERLRLLAIMGVDVYVPRDAPLARAPAVAAGRAPASLASPRAARVLVRGDGADARPPLLAAVLRGARLRGEDWTLSNSSADELAEWRFGYVDAPAAPAALALPSLAELRGSLAARRDAWRLIRTWLRRA